jgi:hypothetical protein
MLPLEDIAAWILDRFLGSVKEVTSVADLTSQHVSTNSPYKFLLRKLLGPGFFKPMSFKLLPGHFQLVLFMLFAAIGYLWLFDSGFSQMGWSSSTFHVGVYALLITFLMGGFLAFLSFIVGRIRFHFTSVSAILVALALMLYAVVQFGGKFGFDTNCYFAIAAPNGPLADREEAKHLGSQNSNDGSFLRVAKLKRELNNASTQQQLQSLSARKTLKEVYSSWNFPRGSDGKRTMVVVTASGGGIQASSWTAKVLSSLDTEFPGFSESVGLVS